MENIPTWWWNSGPEARKGGFSGLTRAMMKAVARWIRHTTQLKEGDVIISVYTMFVDAEDGEEMEENEFDGDQILWQKE